MVYCVLLSCWRWSSLRGWLLPANYASHDSAPWKAPRIGEADRRYAPRFAARLRRLHRRCRPENHPVSPTRWVRRGPIPFLLFERRRHHQQLSKTQYIMYGYWLRVCTIPCTCSVWQLVWMDLRFLWKRKASTSAATLSTCMG